MRILPASKRILIFLLFGLLLALPAPLRAVTLEFPLSDPDDTYNMMNVIVTPALLGTDDEDSDVTGLLVAELGLQIVASDVVVTELTLNEKPLGPGERLLEFSEVHFTYDLGFTIDGTGLGGSMTTIEDPPNTPPSTVTSGQFDAAEQQLTIDRGLFVASFGEPRDMSDVPFSGTSSGTGTIDLVETSRVGSQVTYDVTLTVPIEVEGTIPAPIPVTMQVNGTLQGRTGWTYYGADFDQDLDVDGTDFLTWQRGLDLPGAATPFDGDANLDNQVDAIDLAIWQEQFGTAPTASASTVATVPEPGTVALVLMMGSLLVLPLRRKGSGTSFRLARPWVWQPG